jgi:hypothetical protein
MAVQQFIPSSANDHGASRATPDDECRLAPDRSLTPTLSQRARERWCCANFIVSHYGFCSGVTTRLHSHRGRVRPEPAQAQAVGDDESARDTHRPSRNHRVQQPVGQRIEGPGGERNQGNVI